jgi:hypothetical protein
VGGYQVTDAIAGERGPDRGVRLLLGVNDLTDGATVRSMVVEGGDEYVRDNRPSNSPTRAPLSQSAMGLVPAMAICSWCSLLTRGVTSNVAGTFSVH